MAAQGREPERLPLVVEDEALDDLFDRVRRTRWCDAVPGAGWSHGASLEYLRELADFWVDGFDWRRQEDLVNDRLPGWSACVDGRRVHFARCAGRGPDPLPLGLLHGWPGSFVEMAELLTNATLYWVTGTIRSSMHYYYEDRVGPPAALRPERVDVPTGVARFPAEIMHVPREAVARKYDLRHWSEMPAGGHFSAMEQPEALAADVRDFFRPLRNG